MTSGRIRSNGPRLAPCRLPGVYCSLDGLDIRVSQGQRRNQYRRTRRELFPALSRIQNIGYDQGENGRTPDWYRANHRTPWVAGQVENRAF